MVAFLFFFSFFSTKLFSYCYQGFLYLFLYLSYLLISFTTSGLFFNKYKALRHKSFIFSIILIFSHFRYKAPQLNFFIFLGTRLPSTHFSSLGTRLPSTTSFSSLFNDNHHVNIGSTRPCGSYSLILCFKF